MQFTVKQMFLTTLTLLAVLAVYRHPTDREPGLLLLSCAAIVGGAFGALHQRPLQGIAYAVIGLTGVIVLGRLF